MGPNTRKSQFYYISFIALLVLLSHFQNLTSVIYYKEERNFDFITTNTRDFTCNWTFWLEKVNLISPNYSCTSAAEREVVRPAGGWNHPSSIQERNWKHAFNKYYHSIQSREAYTTMNWSHLFSLYSTDLCCVIGTGWTEWLSHTCLAAMPSIRCASTARRRDFSLPQSSRREQAGLKWRERLWCVTQLEPSQFTALQIPRSQILVWLWVRCIAFNLIWMASFSCNNGSY